MSESTLTPVIIESEVEKESESLTTVEVGGGREAAFRGQQRFFAKLDARSRRSHIYQRRRALLIKVEEL